MNFVPNVPEPHPNSGIACGSLSVELAAHEKTPLCRAFVAGANGFEPVTFGSVGGGPTCAAILFPPGIACRDSSSAVTRADTSGRARTRFGSHLVPTRVPATRADPSATALAAPAAVWGRGRMRFGRG